MLIAPAILLEGAAGILVVFECPDDLSRSPGLISQVLQEKIHYTEGPEEVGEDPRNGQKRGLMDPARHLVLEPSLGEKAPGVRDSFSCKHSSISPRPSGDRTGTQRPPTSQKKKKKKVH